MTVEPAGNGAPRAGPARQAHAPPAERFTLLVRVPTRFVQKYTARARRGVELDAEQAPPDQPRHRQRDLVASTAGVEREPDVELADRLIVEKYLGCGRRRGHRDALRAPIRLERCAARRRQSDDDGHIRQESHGSSSGQAQDDPSLSHARSDVDRDDVRVDLAAGRLRGKAAGRLLSATNARSGRTVQQHGTRCVPWSVSVRKYPEASIPWTGRRPQRGEWALASRASAVSPPPHRRVR